ncbi:hypothetical protein [Mycobacterium paraffinicum]|nr:hypothetical protein [Mycobacterium paraffinicum]
MRVLPEPAPAGGPARGEEITRGIRAGELGRAQPARNSAPSRP